MGLNGCLVSIGFRNLTSRWSVEKFRDDDFWAAEERTEEKIKLIGPSAGGAKENGPRFNRWFEALETKRRTER